MSEEVVELVFLHSSPVKSDFLRKYSLLCVVY